MVCYTSMVDILSRARKLKESVNFFENIPFRVVQLPGAYTCGCSTHCNVELDENAAQKCRILEPGNATVYVLLFNIYAAAGFLQNVSAVRPAMKRRVPPMGPGRSWIAVDKKVQHFVIGDIPHPEAEEIYALLPNN